MASIIPTFLAFTLYTGLCTAAGGNHALDVNTNTQNGKTVAIAITTPGSDFYFAIMSVMGATALGIIVASAFKPTTDRIFFYITAGVNFTAMIAYFTMGSNLGWVPIDVEWIRARAVVAGINREIFYVRYIDWYVVSHRVEEVPPVPYMSSRYMSSHDLQIQEDPRGVP